MRSPISLVTIVQAIAPRLGNNAFTLAATALLMAVTSVRAEEGRYNVLFIVVDDLRPELGCYGTPLIKTPHIDALARKGMVFNRAYCQQAICGPSRTSFLTGLRPDSTRIYDMQTHFRLHRPDVVTLPQYFKEHGYHTQSLGKVFHDLLDDPRSWSAASWAPHDHLYGKPENREAMARDQEQLKSNGKLLQIDQLQRDPATQTVLKIEYKGSDRAIGPAWEDPEVSDHALRDGMLADKAIEILGQKRDQPFFLAVGFYRPHLPFVAPKSYYDLYPSQDIPLARNSNPPEGAPKIALTHLEELRAYSDIPKIGPVSEEKARELIRGYYAAVSYVDAQIGRLLAELDRLQLRERTVVVLCGDHGWQLGEHGLWGKQTNFEVAARTPLIFSVPGKAQRDVATDALVEFVDLYPTLAEVCDLPTPVGLDGTSLVPVLEDPHRSFKKAAFSQYPRGQIMGRSMRTERYRYTEWARAGAPPIGIELYDHDTDPDENINLASKAEFKELTASFATQLHVDWPAATPPANTPAQTHQTK